MKPSNQQFPVTVKTAAAQVEHAGNAYYFCSIHYAIKFEADPQTYLIGETAVGYVHHAPAR